MEHELNGLPIVISTVEHSFKIFENEVKQIYD